MPVRARNLGIEQRLRPGLQAASVDANNQVSWLETLRLRLDRRHYHTIGFPGRLSWDQASAIGGTHKMQNKESDSKQDLTKSHADDSETGTHWVIHRWPSW
jgi:hypothetical protein